MCGCLSARSHRGVRVSSPCRCHLSTTWPPLTTTLLLYFCSTHGELPSCNAAPCWMSTFDRQITFEVASFESASVESLDGSWSSPRLSRLEDEAARVKSTFTILFDSSSPATNQGGGVAGSTTSEATRPDAAIAAAVLGANGLVSDSADSAAGTRASSGGALAGSSGGSKPGRKPDLVIATTGNWTFTNPYSAKSGMMDGRKRGSLLVEKLSCETLTDCTACLLYEPCIWCSGSSSCFARNVDTNLPFDSGIVVQSNPNSFAPGGSSNREYSLLRWYNPPTSMTSFDWYAALASGVATHPREPCSKYLPPCCLQNVEERYSKLLLIFS